MLRFLAGVLAVTMALAAGQAAARGLIRDAEIEHTLRLIANPLFRAAGVNPATVEIYVVNDREPNAFVAGGQNIFINTGLLTELGSVDELRSVIAHELGHITGGHLTRRDEALSGVRGTAAIGMLGALGAAVAGVPEASVAIAAGTAQVAHRSALAYSRSEEASADQAGLRYLAAAGGDPQAMLDVLDHFRGQDALLSAGHVDAYALSHPMWSERMALIEDRVAKMPPGSAPKAEDAYWHRRMVAKLDAFLGSPAQTLRKYPERDASDAAALARAIAWHRRPDPARADAAMQALLAARPDDPYYLDLEGQFLLESGRAAAAARGLPPGRGAGAEGAADPRRARARAHQHGRATRRRRRRATCWRARWRRTRPTAPCCATSRWPRRGSATRGRRRWRRPSASPSRASSATPFATPRGRRRSCPRARRGGGGHRISLPWRDAR